MKKVKIILGLGIVLGVVGGTFLAAFGVLYVKPYMEIRSMEVGECTSVTQEIDKKKSVHCTCANDGSAACLSSYPCLRVFVELRTVNGDVYTNLTLYDSQETFILQSNAHQCSYHKCDRDYNENRKAVLQFSETYGTNGTTYDCYYEPSDLSFTIIEVISKWTILHCMLWPALALVIGFIILMVYLNDPSQAQHHFNSLERPWLRQQARYECIINPGENNAAAITGPVSGPVSGPHGAPSSATSHDPQSRQTHLSTSSSTPIAQLI